MKGAYRAVKEPQAAPIGVIAKTRQYVCNSCILPKSIAVHLDGVAALAVGDALQLPEANYTAKIVEITDDRVVLSKPLPDQELSALVVFFRSDILGQRDREKDICESLGMGT